MFENLISQGSLNGNKYLFYNEICQKKESAIFSPGVTSKHV